MADKTKQPLFGEFPPVSTQAWMDKITADLKGADFEKKLVWKTNEGFSVNPFYRQEDLEQVKYLDSLPNGFPYIRGVKQCNCWFVRQDIVVTDAKSANAKALDLLNKGVNSFGFIFECKNPVTAEDVKILLKGIMSDDIELNFSMCCKNKDLLQLVIDEFKAHGKDLSKAKGSFNIDPIVKKFSVKGKICNSIESKMDELANTANATKNMPRFQPISVNGAVFGNAGATIVQELAFALSAGNEYMAQLTERGVSADDAAKSIRFNLSVNSNYFMEIAKLRAGRLLWATIVKAYNPANDESGKMIVHCETSKFNMTVFDPYVNTLRSQTEAMSATLGGCNSLTVLPFNTAFADANEFSERIARNQQLLLKEESYFDKIVDAGAGSYYIETLTNNIAEQAWKLFVEIEGKGGYVNAFKEGYIQGLIKESASRVRKAISGRREILLGTNQYPNISETVSDAIETGKPECKPTHNDCGCESIVQFRAAEEFEALRLTTEKASKRPKVFMLTYGNLAMRLARSQFSGNFFGCAGYEIIDNLGFENVETGVDAAIKANADIVVLCSSDDEYTDNAPIALNKLNGKAILVVAGAPASMDELKAKGIEHFINVKSNVLETLQNFNNILLRP